jgi:hypothetical protein
MRSVLRPVLPFCILLGADRHLIQYADATLGCLPAIPSSFGEGSRDPSRASLIRPVPRTDHCCRIQLGFVSFTSEDLWSPACLRGLKNFPNGMESFMSIAQPFSSIKLNSIKLQPIIKGGYLVSYTGSVPTDSRLMLAVSNSLSTASNITSAIDVTHQPASHLLNMTNLPSFLALVGKHGLWGTKGYCSLIIAKAGAVVAKSNVETFVAPVRPYTGKLGPFIGRPDSGPKYQYTQNPNGRMLHIPAIGGCYYFEIDAGPNKHCFETNNNMRGLNCITFAGAVFGVSASTGAMSGYGTKLANHLGATQCNLENKSDTEIRAYFAKHPTGTYLMWSATHVVVVVNSKVYEFAHSKHGYAGDQPIEKWNFYNSRHWVRKTPKQF